MTFVYILYGVITALAAVLVAVVAPSVVRDWKHRGEDPVDEHAEEAMAVLAGSDLIDVQVPQGTGEALAREIETWLRKESTS